MLSMSNVQRQTSTAIMQPVTLATTCWLAGGVYYKGFVNALKPMPVPGVATPEEVAAFDPWESVRVEWDVTARDEDKFQVRTAVACFTCSLRCRGAPEGLRLLRSGRHRILLVHAAVGEPLGDRARPGGGRHLGGEAAACCRGRGPRSSCCPRQGPQV